MDIKGFINEKLLEEFKKDLRSLVNIPSVVSRKEGIYPYGKACAEVLDAMLEIGRKYGFETENHDYHCGSIIYGSSGVEIGMLAHLDVVPAEGGSWEHEPFELTEKNGILIGRGTIDDKGPALIGLYAMRILKEAGIDLPFSIRLILGCDEEVGATDMSYFQKVKEPPVFSFTPDYKYPVCMGEKNIVSFKLSCRLPDNIIEITGGNAKNSVPEAASCIIKAPGNIPEQGKISIKALEDGTARITAAGVSAHASTPETGINAIAGLFRYLLDQNLMQGDFENTARFICRAASEYKGREFGIDCEDSDFGYLTCICSVAGIKDGSLEMDFNIRAPIKMTPDIIKNRIEDTAGRHGLKLFEFTCSKGYLRSSGGGFIKILTESAEKVLKEKQVPYTTGGGTYARYLPNTVAFGAEIEKYRGLLGEGKGRAHDPDEYISVSEVTEGIEIFVEAFLGFINEF